MADKIRLEGIMSKGYGITPKLVNKDRRLSIEAKGIYNYLMSYVGSGEIAFPSVEMMCEDLNVSRNRFYRHREMLVELGYIRIDRERKGSKWGNNIYTIIQSVPKDPQWRQNEYIQNEDIQNEDIQNDATINNTNINNTNNNNKEIKDTVRKPDFAPDVIVYLNNRADKKFKKSTQSSLRKIKARIEEGNTFEDFKTVIDHKTKEWSNDPKMKKYLRPETLFGTKFESYLNEIDYEAQKRKKSNDSKFKTFEDLKNDVQT